MTAGGRFRTLEVGGIPYRYCSLAGAEEAAPGLARLPRSLKVLAENLLRHGDAGSAAKVAAGDGRPEIAFRPARILMQDFTGVPAIADLAAMRDAARAAGAPVERIDPRTPVDLVIDHSVTVDRFGSAGAFAGNVGLEFERNRERYEFLRWGQEAFGSLRVVPPGTGICHQVNLEHLAQVVWTEDGDGGRLAYPDTLVGTDSHTTMVNGLAVLGWGVGGIEAEAAMLGRPISMLVPEVVGVRLVGRMPEGAGATDLVLTVTRVLRELGVVGKFVEFFGSGVADLPLADRATLANMAPEYGATCGFFPVDGETLRYLELTGRDPERVALVEAYAQEQGLWLGPDAPEPAFADTVEIDLAGVGPSLAGPKRPQDRVALAEAPAAMAAAADTDAGPEAPVAGTDYALRNGDVVIAAITSCTNTSNPSAMVAAGLLARKAVARGLARRPWVKTSLAPGSQVVTDYLDAAGLTAPLEELGFHLVGYGCTTCIGNSGPLDPAIEEAVRAADGLSLCAVLSGNRNFEGRIHPLVRANWLASPALVVAYAIAGTLRADLVREPLGADADGNDVFLRDVWPGNAEIADTIAAALRPEMFRDRYAKVFEGPEEWRAIAAGGGATYEWKPASTYVRRPPFFDDSIPPAADGDIAGARALLVLGDSVTTDHISPAGAIAEDSPAGGWLRDRQVQPREFNSYGSRRGNHEVMIRGTFANIRIRNAIAPGTEGGVTRHMPGGETMPVFEAAERYRDEGVPLVVLAGREYGTGSSRDWAAKGTRLLGIRAVVAESFERIHRSNLAGMGVLPLELDDGVRVAGLGLDGTETFDILGLGGGPVPRAALTLAVRRADGREERLGLTCRIDTADEAEAFRNGGILPHVLAQMAGGGAA